LNELLGRGRAKNGMFEGDLENGELEIGQVAAQITEVRPVAEIMGNMTKDYNQIKEEMKAGNRFLF
jgi:enoyl-[acyl-carrier protein] reductase II